MINTQLERSQLARELAQIYHELNYFNHTALCIPDMLPFHYTLPTVHQRRSSLQFFTSEHPVNRNNIEQHYAVLLFKPVSFYLQASKVDADSFLARFLELASPFVTLETMSVLLGAPLQKVYACALSLQAANTAVILMCITKYTHFAVHLLPPRHLAGAATRPRGGAAGLPRLRGPVQGPRLPRQPPRALQQRPLARLRLSPAQRLLHLLHGAHRRVRLRVRRAGGLAGPLRRSSG